MESSGNNSGSPHAHRYNTRSKIHKTYKCYKEDDSDLSDNDYMENDDNTSKIEKCQLFLLIK